MVHEGFAAFLIGAIIGAVIFYARHFSRDREYSRLDQAWQRVEHDKERR